MSTSGDAALDEAAAAVSRLAVLLSAGIAPASAVAHLPEPLGTRLAARIADGATVREALSAEGGAGAGPTAGGQAWDAVASAWAVAEESGAPLAPTLSRFAGTLRALAQAQRDLRVAIAGPAATGRLVLALPPLGLLVGQMLGLETLRILFATGAGAGCLAIGSALLLWGWAWTRRLVRAAMPPPVLAGVELDLVGIAVAGGAPPERAVALVQAHCPALTGPPRALELSARAGVPVGGLLREEAEEARALHLDAARLRIARLSVALMLPLGLCVLPAFVALGVAPLLLGMLASSSLPL